MKKLSFQVRGRNKKIVERKINDYDTLLEIYKRQKKMVEQIYLDDKIAREQEQKQVRIQKKSILKKRTIPQKKSILKRTKKGTSTEVRSYKQVSFINTQIKYYHLSEEERFEKYLQFRLIYDNLKYY